MTEIRQEVMKLLGCNQWKAIKNGDCMDIYLKGEEQGKIARVFTSNKHKDDWNARLIEAAPEIYSLLKEKVWENLPLTFAHEGTWLAQARAALAFIEGFEQ